MLNLFGTFITGLSAHDKADPAHASMFLEHERRKGEELRHRLTHEKRFLRGR